MNIKEIIQQKEQLRQQTDEQEIIDAINFLRQRNYIVFHVSETMNFLKELEEKSNGEIQFYFAEDLQEVDGEKVDLDTVIERYNKLIDTYYEQQEKIQKQQQEIEQLTNRIHELETELEELKLREQAYQETENMTEVDDYLLTQEQHDEHIESDVESDVEYNTQDNIDDEHSDDTQDEHLDEQLDGYSDEHTKEESYTYFAGTDKELKTNEQIDEQTNEQMNFKTYEQVVDELVGEFEGQNEEEDEYVLMLI